MFEDRDGLLKHYRETRTDLLAAIDGLSDELMVAPWLDGWSVKDHLAHLALWDDVRASEVARITAGHDSAWRMTDQQDGAYNSLGYELRAGLSLGQVLWELENSRRRLMDAIAVSAARGLDGSLYGEAGLHSGHEAEHAGWIRRHREEMLAEH
ncbi:MAG: DinB family protein [Anaerolineaceae bacterium]